MQKSVLVEEVNVSPPFSETISPGFKLRLFILVKVLKAVFSEVPLFESAPPLLT